MPQKRSDEYELRTASGTLELRAAGDDDAPPRIKGVAAVFNSLSENLGGFREIIAPGAFDETDMSDVRALFNHRDDYVLGRNKSGTLNINVTERGLEYEVDAPQTGMLHDLVTVPIRRGDIDQSSFGFIVGKGNDEWEENDEGVIIRTIKKFQRLFDVSPVTFPAYPAASVAVRGFREFIEQKELTAAEIAEARKRNRFLDAADRRAFLSGAASRGNAG